MKPRRTASSRRRIRPQFVDGAEAVMYSDLADRVRYGGNPEHKRNPGDFGLRPPSLPRQGKSLCDDAGIFSRAEALKLVQEGLRRGLVSVQHRQGWPQNVWAVTVKGVPLEAMLENAVAGVYHGYPLAEGDPLAGQVLERWELS